MCHQVFYEFSKPDEFGRPGCGDSVYWKDIECSYKTALSKAKNDAEKDSLREKCRLDSLEQEIVGRKGLCHDCYNAQR
jgi:hypothetical protein